jgi:hypothetical protein
LGRGDASDKSVKALDAYLAKMGSDVFNTYRAKVGIKPNTPNYRLSKRQAWLLRQEIEKAAEAGR